MAEPIYFRTVITTNTSPPSYNEYGERRCEVNMELPQNLIARAKEVVRATMSVMKMVVPMEVMQVASIPVIDRSGSSGAVSFTGEYGTIYPIGAGRYPIEFGKWEKQTSQAVFTEIPREYEANVVASRWLERKSAGELERQEGKHFFRTLEEVCLFFSEFFTRVMMRNMDVIDAEWRPGVEFHVRSDNTIGMRINNYDFRQVIPAHQNVLMQKQGDSYYSTVTVSENPDFTTPSVTGKRYRNQQFVFMVTEGLRDLFHTLPWLRVTAARLEEEFQVPVPALMRNKALYILDTRQASLSFGSPFPVIRQVGDLRVQDQRFVHPLEYVFPEADAVSLTQVSAITLTLEGASCTQEVFPMNVITPEVSQIVSFPIINVYLPLKTRPSDNKTDMIVAKDAFSNAAPIELDPQMFLERNLSFKLFYVSANGERRQVFIPSDRPFFFELCFAIWFRD